MSHESENYAAAVEAELFTGNSLTDHMRQLRRRSRGGIRWLVYAALVGVGIAGGFVIFFAG